MEPPANSDRPIGHGTHVAGVLGADWRELEKVVFQGVCPDIRLYDLRVLGDANSDTEFAVIAALEFIRWLNGRNRYLSIHGVNMSIGIQHDMSNFACGQTPVCRAADATVRSGVVVVASAGNWGSQNFLTSSGSYRGYAPVRWRPGKGLHGIPRAAAARRTRKRAIATRRSASHRRSHIDDDHIAGVLDFFASLRQADDDNIPRDYDVTHLLHNSFDGLLGEGEGGAARGAGGETVLAGLGGAAGILANLPEFDDDALFVLQSYPNGSKLSTLAAALGIARNPPRQKSISFERNAPRVLRLGDASLTIVGPLEEEIEDLRTKWKEYLEKKAEKKEVFQAYLDSSIPNLSSIVAFLECNGATALLTGDARGDHVIKGLKKAKLLTDGAPLKVDILKMPHHGSVRNIKDEFFETIQADHYVVSGTAHSEIRTGKPSNCWSRQDQAAVLQFT